MMALLASRAMSGGRSNVPEAGNTGGQGHLLNKFRQGGLEDIINSWIGAGSNKPIAPNQLHEALGAETVNDLSRETGMPQGDLLTQLSRLLPGVVDKITPDGRLPDEKDLLPGPEDNRA